VPKEWFGWLLINYAASDVAVFGAKPQYATINLLAPTGTKITALERAMKQACKAADELKVAIITGHTGTYEALSTTVGTCTSYGIIKRDQLITPGGAKPGDYLICTKPIGLETLVNFTLTNRKRAEEIFGDLGALKLTRQVKMQTCVNEALLLAETGVVHAMHDATEGGFVAALNEIADASNVGFSVDYSKLPMSSNLEKLAKYFHLDTNQILSTSSTGMIVAAVAPSGISRVINALSKLGLSARAVGVFLESQERSIKFDGKETFFPKHYDDPYSKIMCY
jgi:hydrogenase expression/formation protein HypE